LYLKTEKGSVKGSDTQILPPMTRWGIDRKPGSFQAKKTFIDYSEKGNRIKALLEDIASKNDYELKIYDISKTNDSIHARTKGIRNTPAVIIDNNKFELNDILKHIFGPDIGKAGYKDETKEYICPKCKSDNIEVYEDLSGFCNACSGPFMKGKESE